MPKLKILKARRVTPIPNEGDKKHIFIGYWRQLARNEIEPVSEYFFAKPRRFRFDWSFPEVKLAVEVDGGDHMVRCTRTGEIVPVGRHTKDEDKIKRNLATELGWRVFHYSPRMITDNPEGVITQVWTTLIRLREGKFNG